MIRVGLDHAEICVSWCVVAFGFLWENLIMAFDWLASGDFGEREEQIDREYHSEVEINIWDYPTHASMDALCICALFYRSFGGNQVGGRCKEQALSPGCAEFARGFRRHDGEVSNGFTGLAPIWRFSASPLSVLNLQYSECVFALAALQR
jgi:hypothetical protein